jgi:aldehyde:ferredoxin oxidoreductase
VPLYMVGYSCPHSKTRREAIGLLLGTRRREGLWDAVMAGKIVQWVMEVEEEGGLDDEGYVREDGRMVNLTLRYDLMERTANVKGLMPVKGKAELREVEADLAW